MAKAKVTLSVDADILREAKVYLADQNGTVSAALEETLKEMTTSRFIDEVAKEIGVELGYVSHEDIVRKRPKGRDAGRAVREMRDARKEALSR